MDLQYYYEELANAIILCAANDYRAALKGLKANPRNWRAKAGKDDIERSSVPGGSPYLRVLMARC